MTKVKPFMHISLEGECPGREKTQLNQEMCARAWLRLRLIGQRHERISESVRIVTRTQQHQEPLARTITRSVKQHSNGSTVHPKSSKLSHRDPEPAIQTAQAGPTKAGFTLGASRVIDEVPRAEAPRDWTQVTWVLVLSMWSGPLSTVTQQLDQKGGCALQNHEMEPKLTTRVQDERMISHSNPSEGF